MNWKPLFFKPIIKERIWGGHKLSSLLGKKTPYLHNGESWELSTVPENESEISGGVFEGKKLSEVMKTFPNEILGQSWVDKNGKDFPLLFKYLDAAQDLSIQVHPNDAYAKEKHNCLGKNEMWYIVQAEPESRIILGFKKDTLPEEFESHVIKNQVTDLLNEIKVQKGDVFYIETGTIHAIGAGIVLAEIQQTSDITYRVFDWNRLDNEGQHRELHIQNALETLNFNPTNSRIDYSKEINLENQMVDSTFFTTTFLPLNGTKPTQSKETFSVYMCVEGEAELKLENETFHIHQGVTFLIPAAMGNFNLIGKANFLVSCVRE